MDSAGNIFAADVENNIVVKVTPQGILNVVAGNQTRGAGGDGGPATSAQLFTPTGLAIDAVGNLYIAEQSNHRVRKVSVDGIITTFAGNNIDQFSGDEGPATNASINRPYDVAVDLAGNVYIADWGNFRIRRIGTDGIITTVAGNGTCQYPGFPEDGGPAVDPPLCWPSGLAVDDPGNLYIAEAGRIRKVSPSGIITTVADSLAPPEGIALDPAGNLYVAEIRGNRIRKVSTDGIITTVAGNGVEGFSGDGGPATGASLNSPGAVGVDAVGNLVIADRGNARIRRVGLDGRITTTAGNGFFKFAGDGGPARSSSLENPKGLTLDRLGNLFLADSGNDRVRRISPDGNITTVAGNGARGFSGDGEQAIGASLSSPSDVALDIAGNLFIVDEINQRVRKVSPLGVISTVAGNGQRGFSGDDSLAIDASFDLPSGL